MKPAAVLVTPAEGKTYADVLAKMTAGVDVDGIGASVCTIRQTAKGSVLVELGKMDTTVQAHFEKAITDVVDDEASVRTLIPQLTVKIRGITSTSTKKEVEAFKKTLAESTPENMEVWLSPTALRGTRLAKVNLAAPMARALVGHR